MNRDWVLEFCAYAISALMFFTGIMELHDYNIQHKSIWWKRIGCAWIAAAMIVAGGMLLWSVVG